MIDYLSVSLTYFIIMTATKVVYHITSKSEEKQTVGRWVKRLLVSLCFSLIPVVRFIVAAVSGIFILLPEEKQKAIIGKRERGVGMNIIKKSDKRKLLSILVFECERCGCVFECDNTEYKTQSGNRNDSYAVMECPTCKGTVTTKIGR